MSASETAARHARDSQVAIDEDAEPLLVTETTSAALETRIAITHKVTRAMRPPRPDEPDRGAPYCCCGHPYCCCGHAGCG
jgi:hypothetical protein